MPETERAALEAGDVWIDYCSPALPALRFVAEHDENEAVRQFAARVVAAAEG